ncbi:MAG: 16S rRNA (cytosine(1402)-N(4))-methyltransferase RsmH [Deltaproteobacteria bacterium]|jgi:16S rRNA (cytosine1402-N4)-methyltransferase|nr:16S rRNA (cytosine(1402)-N(4))-methyltransferase RsmH [Deltaproteobacteria bacterium]
MVKNKESKIPEFASLAYFPDEPQGRGGEAGAPFPASGEGPSWEALPPEVSFAEAFGHCPVMLDESVAALNVKPEGFYVDGTVGGGGHARAILGRLGPQGKLLALDADPECVAFAKHWGAGERRLIALEANFADLRRVLKEEGLGPADGILLDLGINSRQLAAPNRGFSIASDGPLDMRLSPKTATTAAKLVNSLSEKKLADLIFAYGEDRRSRAIAREIARARAETPFRTTGELAAVIARLSSKRDGKEFIHPATRVFQALRIAVNGELSSLERFLDEAYGLLKPQGRLAVISFHSLEDRLVKNLFRARPKYEESRWKAILKKPIRPQESEIFMNHRARSAKLRVATRL